MCQYCTVSAVAVSVSLGLIATGGSDGAIVLIELRKYRALRVLHTGVKRSPLLACTALHVPTGPCRALLWGLARPPVHGGVHVAYWWWRPPACVYVRVCACLC
jgi:hypothetical protein